MTKRIPFDLDMWLKNPEYKVFIRGGKEVEDLHYFRKADPDKIYGTFEGCQDIHAWYSSGFIFADFGISPYDLFLEIPLKLKEFNLQEWLNRGKPDCYTRDGHKVAQIIYEPEVIDEYKLCGVLFRKSVTFETWNELGKSSAVYVFNQLKHVAELDLMLVDEE